MSFLSFFFFFGFLFLGLVLKRKKRKEKNLDVVVRQEKGFLLKQSFVGNMKMMFFMISEVKLFKRLKQFGD